MLAEVGGVGMAIEVGVGVMAADTVGVWTGCAAAYRLAELARSVREVSGDGRRRWAAEVGGGGGRRRWAAEVGGGGGRRRWAAEGSSAEGSGGRRRKGGGRRGNSARRKARRQGKQCKEVEKMWLG